MARFPEAERRLLHKMICMEYHPASEPGFSITMQDHFSEPRAGL